jgi:putative heme-binding domain-containing protein
VEEILKIAGANYSPTVAETIIALLAGNIHSQDVSAASEAPNYDKLVFAFASGLQRAGTTLAKADRVGALNSVFAKAAKTATDTEVVASDRSQAIGLLAFTSFKDALAPLTACAAGGQPEAVQLAAIAAFGRFSDAGVAAPLLKHWSGFSARVKAEALGVLLARPERALLLLKAVQTGGVKRADLSSAQVEALHKSKNKEVASLAAKVLPVEKKVARDEIIKQFSAALTLKGDAAKGRAIYAERCLSCHVAEKQGHALGPDLVTVKTAGRERLLTSIVDPNKEIAPQYLAFNIETRDGESFTGVVTRDEASGVTLRQAFGREDTLARAQIKSMRSPGQSLMPEDLQLGLTPQQMADLLTFIEEVK